MAVPKHIQDLLDKQKEQGFQALTSEEQRQLFDYAMENEEEPPLAELEPIAEALGLALAGGSILGPAAEAVQAGMGLAGALPSAGVASAKAARGLSTLRAATNWARKNKLLAATGGALVGGAAIGMGMGGGGALTNQTTTPTPQKPSSTRNRQPMVLVDPNSGQTFQIDPNEAPTLGGGGLGAVGNFGPEITNRASAAGIDVTSVLASSGVGGGALDATFLGEVRLDQPVSFTYRRPTPQLGPKSPIGGTEVEKVPYAPVPGRPGMVGPVTRKTGMAQDPTATSITVPAGAKINPRVSQVHKGRTLLEWAARSAERYGVPLNLVYGMVQLESGWNPEAVGDSGNSFGLAQIYMPAHPGIRPGNAKSPVFALDFLAKNLAANFQKYGRWDAAVLAHNSPRAANVLAATNKYDGARFRNYVTQAMGYAQGSGLSNEIYDLEELDYAELTGGGGTGPKAPPYVAPDPATIQAFVKDAYSDILKRDPTPQEIESGTQKLLGLSRQQYQSTVSAQVYGSNTEAVDPEARFLQELQGTGEATFRKETESQRSFFDYASQIARMLQAGG